MEKCIALYCYKFHIQIWNSEIQLQTLKTNALSAFQSFLDHVTKFLIRTEDFCFCFNQLISLVWHPLGHFFKNSIIQKQKSEGDNDFVHIFSKIMNLFSNRKRLRSTVKFFWYFKKIDEHFFFISLVTKFRILIWFKTHFCLQNLSVSMIFCIQLYIYYHCHKKKQLLSLISGTTRFQKKIVLIDKKF